MKLKFPEGVSHYHDVSGNTHRPDAEGFIEVDHPQLIGEMLKAGFEDKGGGDGQAEATGSGGDAAAPVGGVEGVGQEPSGAAEGGEKEPGSEYL